MTPFSQDEINRIMRLFFIGLFGMIAWFSNHLFHGRRLPIGRLVGGLLGAMIASISVVGLVYSVNTSPSVELLFGVSGIVGWIGGNSLARIFDLMEQKMRDTLGLEEDKNESDGAI